MIQISINSSTFTQQLFGTDTYGSRWNIEVFDGWDGADVRQDLHHPVRRQGSAFGEWLYGARTMTIEGHCWSPTEAHMWDARNRLAAASAATTVNGNLLVIEPGENAYGMYFRRAGRLNMKTLTAYTFQYNLPIISADPRKYSVNIQNVHFSSPGTLNVFSAGTIDTYPTFTVHGPCSSVTLIGQSGGVNVAVIAHVAVPSGQDLAFSFETRDVTLNGVPRYDVIDPISTWWTLNPGINPIGFSADTGTADIAWKDAWI